MSEALILIVDDDRTAAMDVRGTLMQIGYRVPYPVRAGAEAVSKAAELKPDLIIADISPRIELTGLDAVRQIRERINVPVIYIAGDSSPEMFRRALETNPVAYLLKPVSRDDLHATVASALQKGGLERKLSASEERYRTLFEESPEPIIIFSTDGFVLNINSAYEQFTGYSKEETLGVIFTKLPVLKQEHMPEYLEIYRNMMRGNKLHRMDIPVIHKNGTEMYVEIFISSLVKEGKTTGFQIIARDITEQKKLERNLHRELAVNAALADLSETIIRPDITVESMSVMVLKHAKELTRSEHGYVGIIDQKTGDLVCPTLTDMMGKECTVAGGRNQIMFPANPDGSYNALWGHALNTLKPFYTNTPKRHSSSKDIPSGHVPVTNFLSVPAIAGSTLLGQIALANAAHDYTERDLDTVRRLADLYALVLQRLNYQNELKEANELLEQRVMERTKELMNEIEERKKAELQLREGEEVARALIDSPSEPVFLASVDGTVIDLNSELEKRLGMAKSEIVGRSMFDFLSKRTAARYREKMEAVAVSGKALRFENQLGDSWYDTIMYPVPNHRGLVAKVAIFSHDITETRRLQKDIMEISELERNRIGQELHDGLGQKLTGIGFLSEALKRTMKEKDYPELSDVEEITDNIAESIEQARKISSGLWTTRLESYDAERALQELADDTENLFGITCKLESRISYPVYNSTMVINLYFIARESINNAIRHGRAGRVDIHLSDDRDSLYLEVKDNGIGAAATFREGNGIGLRIMQYRAGIIGGTCSFESIGQGFTVRVTIRKEFIDTYL